MKIRVVPIIVGAFGIMPKHNSIGIGWDGKLGKNCDSSNHANAGVYKVLEIRAELLPALYPWPAVITLKKIGNLGFWPVLGLVNVCAKTKTLSTQVHKLLKCCSIRERKYLKYCQADFLSCLNVAQSEYSCCLNVWLIFLCLALINRETFQCICTRRINRNLEYRLY